MHPTPTPNTPPRKPERYLRLPEVESLTGLKKSSIYAGMKASPPTFPYCIRLSTRAVAWRESDIATWQAQRVQAKAAPGPEEPAQRDRERIERQPAGSKA